MAKKFISLDRLSDYHTLLKEKYVASITAANNAITPTYGDGDTGTAVSLIRYGVCTTAAATAIKEVSIPGVTQLSEGLDVFVKFTIANSAATGNLKLNVSSTGEKAIKRYGTTNMAATGNLGAGMVCHFIYDGTNWLWVGHVDTTTTYSNASLGTGYGTCPTAYGTPAKLVTLSSYSATINGFVAVKFSYDVDANATLNINNKGAKAIYYKGAPITDGVIKSGDVALFVYNTYYHLISIDKSVTCCTKGYDETITITSGNWTGDDTNGWTSVKSITTNILDTDNYDIVLDPADDATIDALFDNSIDLASASTANNTITLTADSKPTGTLTFNVRVLIHDM